MSERVNASAWTEEEWQATVRYAEEHAGEFEPNDTVEHALDQLRATQDKLFEAISALKPERLPMSDFGKFLFDMANDMNREIANQYRRNLDLPPLH